MADCLFCKIVAGEIPSNKAYEDEQVLAFYDIAPMAPVHVLVISKMHIDAVSEITPENSAIVAHIFEVIAKLAADLKLENGFRVISNCGKDACQSVKHLHFHVLAGKQLSEKLD